MDITWSLQKYFLKSVHPYFLYMENTISAFFMDGPIRGDGQKFGEKRPKFGDTFPT